MYFSLCCVYNVPPLTGQVFGKVLFNQLGNKLTIVDDFRTSSLFWFQGYLHIVHVTELPGPVTRFLTSIISYCSYKFIGDQLFGHCLSESSLSPGPVL